MSEATTQDILIHTEAGVCTITFNRVEKKNSLTQAMYATLADTLGQAEADAHAGHLPELRIAIDPAADYQALVRVLATADDAGMQRIRFEQR